VEKQEDEMQVTTEMDGFQQQTVERSSFISLTINEQHSEKKE